MICLKLSNGFGFLPYSENKHVWSIIIKYFTEPVEVANSATLEIYHECALSKVSTNPWMSPKHKIWTNKLVFSMQKSVDLTFEVK